MISTSTDGEITAYHEKFFAGMSIRQLICTAVAILIAVGTAFMGLYLLHLPINALGYVIMLIDCPLLAIGWIRIKGYPFEIYAIIWANWHLHSQHYPIKQKEVYGNDTIQHNRQKNHKRHNEGGSGRPQACHQGTAAARKAATAAKKEIRAEQRQMAQRRCEAARAKKRG